MMKTLFAILLPLVSAGPACGAARVVEEKSVDKDKLAAEVKSEFLHAWRGYRQHAWGHDDLAPLSRKPHDWYAHSLLMTPVDALDTLLLMV